MDAVQRIKGLLAKQRAIHEVTVALAQRVDAEVQPALEAALTLVAGAAAAPMACLHLMDDEAGVLVLVASHQMDPLLIRAWGRLSLDGSSLPAAVAAAGGTVEAQGERAPAGLAAAVSAPIQGVEITVGVLSLLWPPPQAPDPDPDLLGFLQTAGHLLGLVIEHAGLVSELETNLDEVRRLKNLEEEKNRQLTDLNQTLKEVNDLLGELSSTDELTRLFNRRHFMDRLSQEIQRARRQGQPLCLLIADLDHFKRVNDTLGHQAGDRALKEFAVVLKGNVREVDVVGRYGGEEFIVALSDCNLQAGIKVAEKLRAAVKGAFLAPPFDALGGLTVSLGVSELTPQDGADDLIARADRALYAAKANGRDRVEQA